MCNQTVMNKYKNKTLLFVLGLQCGSEIDVKFDIFWRKTPAGITAIQPCTTTPNATGKHLIFCTLQNFTSFLFCKILEPAQLPGCAVTMESGKKQISQLATIGELIIF